MLGVRPSRWISFPGFRFDRAARRRLTIEALSRYSPDEASLRRICRGEFFVGTFRSSLSHVTYYQQTGGLHEQVATAPLWGE